MSTCRAARACVPSCTRRLHPAGARSVSPRIALPAPRWVRCFLPLRRCDWHKWTSAEAVDLWPLCGPTVHGAWLRCVHGSATPMCLHLTRALTLTRVSRHTGGGRGAGRARVAVAHAQPDRKPDHRGLAWLVAALGECNTRRGRRSARRHVESRRLQRGPHARGRSA
eukprot:scaffold113113_cov81-Phaeocystis_antarctica.AAC.3